MPNLSLITRLASQVPAVAAAPAFVATDSFAVARASASGTAPCAPGFPYGEASTWPGKLNEHALRLDSLARYGGGARGVCNGLTITAGTGLFASVAPGQGICDGLAELSATASVAVSDGAWVYLWLRQTGMVVASPNSLLPPSGAASVFIGAVQTQNGTIVKIDYSGVAYLRGGHAVRYTADTSTPSDTPTANAPLVYTRTLGGLYINVDGTYLPVDIPDNSVTSAKIAPGAVGPTDLAAGAVTAPALAVTPTPGYVLGFNGSGVLISLPPSSGGSGGSVAWGDITGKPSAFSPALHAATHASGGADPVSPASIGASAIGHTHPASDITGLPDAIPPTLHAATHASGGSDAVTPAAIGAAPTSHTHDDRYYTKAEDNTLLSGKSAIGHTHTIGQIGGAGTAASRSVPASGDAAGAEVVLGSDSRLTDARTPTTHTHAASDVTSGTFSASRFPGFDAATDGYFPRKSGGALVWGAAPSGGGGGGSVDWTNIDNKPSTFAPSAHASSHGSGGSDPVSPASIGAAPAVHTHTLSQVTDAGTAASKNAPVSGDAAVGEVVLGSDARLTNARTPAQHRLTHATNGSDPLSPGDIGAAATTHSHAASDVTSGVFSGSRLAGFDAATDGYFLRKSGGALVWAAPPSGGSGGSSVIVPRYTLFFLAGKTPVSGLDGEVKILPYAPDGTTLYFVPVALRMRLETPGSSATQAWAQRHTGTGTWAGVDTIGVSLPSGSYEPSGAQPAVPVSGADSTPRSGDKIRLRFASVGGGAAGANASVEFMPSTTNPEQ